MTPTNQLDRLARLPQAGGPAARLVNRVSRLWPALSRRGFLANVALVGSAVATDPRRYVLTPVTAYASVCGPASTAADGYTVFCCTVNNGVNACPPGSFTAGWWKAADSSWCCGGYRYILDCNAQCTRCTSECSGDHICDRGCWNCSCGQGSSATCDQRRYCCNGFRYGQCNTQVGCSGGVVCRVVSCVPPYRWDSCSTTSLSDNATSEHSAPCEQGCSAILLKYNALGANGSSLRASVGPERPIGDGRGRFVNYQNGSILWTASTGANSVFGASYAKYLEQGGVLGVLGYPTAERASQPDGSGWVQTFENGMICDSVRTYTTSVFGASYAKYVERGRETGALGYPTAERVRSGSGWVQTFEHGVLSDRDRDGGPAGVAAVTGALYDRYAALGRELGRLGFARADARAGRDGRGVGQVFGGGQLWRLASDPVRLLVGTVLARWLADGAETGRWGYPLSDVRDGPGDTRQATFEGGVLTA